jgi:hypothetical protein
VTPDELVERWDSQQTAYIADREGRFTAILDTLDLAAGDEFTAVDLACGPDSLTARVLNRFPQSRVVAVDYDPMLLELAREYLDDHGHRVCFVDADLTEPQWSDRVAEQLDTSPRAVLSTTALHWLQPEQVVGLYGRIKSMLGPGGLFLNGDHFRFDGIDQYITQWSAQHDRSTSASVSLRGRTSGINGGTCCGHTPASGSCTTNERADSHIGPVLPRPRCNFSSPRCDRRVSPSQGPSGNCSMTTSSTESSDHADDVTNSDCSVGADDGGTITTHACSGDSVPRGDASSLGFLRCRIGRPWEPVGRRMLCAWSDLAFR